MIQLDLFFPQSLHFDFILVLYIIKFYLEVIKFNLFHV